MRRKIMLPVIIAGTVLAVSTAVVLLVVIPGDPRPVRQQPKEPDAKRVLSEEQQIKEILRPKTTRELVRKMKRNPVLYGAETVNITDNVIAALNADYARSQKRGAEGRQPAPPPPPAPPRPK